MKGRELRLTIRAWQVTWWPRDVMLGRPFFQDQPGYWCLSIGRLTVSWLRQARV